MHNGKQISGWFKGVIAIAIILGIFFRFFHLDRKVYWFDEVYSTTRMAGYTIEEVRQEIFQNQILTAPALQKYQQPKPNSNLLDTIDVLIQEDAKHPPLYYSLGSLWMRQFGSSITLTRCLPALISVLALPLMFLLGIELFSSHIIASLATGLIALSPFDILFAQTVRQYSLLTVLILASSWLLLRALRLNRWQAWGWYTVVCAMGLYTHLFFSLTLLAQGVFTVSQQLFTRAPSKPFLHKLRSLFPYVLAIAGTFILYIPWTVALLTGGERTYASSNWLSSSLHFVTLIKFWILSFSSLFFDLDLGFNHPITYLLRLPFIVLIVWAFYLLWKKASHIASRFVLASSLIPFLALALPDLILGGQRSAITRYLVCSFPGIQLAVAYLLGTYLPNRRVWRGIWATILTASLASCVVSAYSSSWWSKGVSVANDKTANLLNSLETPLVISDLGDSYLNQGNLISLSYRLAEDVQLLLINEDAIAEGLSKVRTSNITDVVFYSPSSALQQQATAKWGELTFMEPPEANILYLKQD
ncbi:MAG: glycosyltransferase family 39 protein [Cyanobacteria bacterium P01_D01_bin.156]